MRHGHSRPLRRVAALAATAVAVLIPGIVPAHGDTGAFRITWDDYHSGFSNSGTDAKWFTPPSGNFQYGDAVESTAPGHLHVVPTGVNPTTHKPAFAYTTGQEADGGQGASDQLKWIAVANHQASSGYLGWDTVDGQVLTCDTTMAVQTFGTEKNPFGRYVSNPNTDPRLAAGTVIALDMETRTVFDFFITNNEIYAFYEKLPVPGDTSAAFSYAVPVAARTPGQVSDFAISLDKSHGVATWKINGRSVLSVNRIGYRALDRRYLLLDHGGTEHTIMPRQLTCGMGMFTLLDGAMYNAPGLVRLSSQPNFYFKTATGAPNPQTFFDEHSLSANRLWGQGEQLDLGPMRVSSTPTS